MTEPLKSLRRDLARNEHTIARLVLVVFRFGQFALAQPKPARAVLRRVYWLADLLLVQIVAGVELPATVRCGPGLYLPHGGRGLVVHPAAVIGSEVSLFHQVTIGDRGTPPGVPTIADRAYVATGACVLGPVTLGEGCRVGAGAVVLTDVPAGCRAVGVPARVLADHARATA